MRKVINHIKCTLAGYAFANFRFKGRRFLFAALFATLFLPAETLMIVPLFMIMKKFGWVNTYWALTVPFLAGATNTFLFRQHFLSIPKELEDATKIDGATPMQYFSFQSYDRWSGNDKFRFCMEYVFVAIDCYNG